MEYVVNNNPEKSRFEVVVEGVTAYLEYELSDGKIDLNHTLVPRSIEGKGVAAALTRFAVDYAAQYLLQVIPTCPYVESYIRHRKNKKG